MGSILDSRDKIKKIDKSNLLRSVEALPDQIVDALEQTKKIVVPPDYSQIKNIVVSGMGGSILGSYVIKGLYKDYLKVPFEIVPHYMLPNYVNADSLVLLSSYSGTTEETLAATTDAHNRGAKIMVIASGGALADFAIVNHYPLYQIKATHNPSSQPRLAIGYTIAGQLALFAKTGLLPNLYDELITIAGNLRALVKNLGPETLNNPAKLLSFAAYEKHIIFVAAEHLIGAAHVVNNQVNENAKTLTSEWHLPEFNHHYMEALQFPMANHDTTIFFLINSDLYHKRVTKRFPLTKKLLQAKEYETQLIQATAPTKLAQVFEIIQLGEFVAAYLAFLYKIPNPGPVPNVEWFKSQMAK